MIGCVPCLLYYASGESYDLAFGEAKIPYSYGKLTKKKKKVIIFLTYAKWTV